MQTATTEAIQQAHAILNGAFNVSTIFKDLRANWSEQERDQLVNNKMEKLFNALNDLEYEMR